MGIQFEQVTFTYGSSGNKRQANNANSNAVPPILHNISLHLKRGKFTAVLGQSGSGKSTLLQQLNGILKPQKGNVHVLDMTLSSDPSAATLQAVRRRVGLVFQFPEQQCFEQTVAAEIGFALRNYGMGENEIEIAVKRAASSVGLTAELLSCHPFALSSGQMRKVAIASILVMDPDIIALDEPTASLDQQSRHELMQLLDRLCREQGKTIVIVTHRLDEVFPYADDYVVMDEGRVMFHGDARRLLLHAPELEQTGLHLPPAVRLWTLLSQRFAVELPTEVCTSEHMIAYITDQLLSHMKVRG